MRWTSPVGATLLIGGVLGVGVYVVAVLDVVAGRLVARSSVLVGDALLQPARRGALDLVTRRSSTRRPDAAAWALAPALVLSMAAVGTASVPYDRTVAAADVTDGIVLFGAAMAIVMVGVFLHGWSANSPMPLLGGYRFIAAALSYEMPLALVLIAAALPARSLSVGAIVVSQAGLWNVVRQPLGLPLYLVAAAGLAFWGPLQQPDAADLAGGTASEVSGPARLAWKVAQCSVLVAAACMGAAVFLGGWQGPVLPGWTWMALKTIAVLGVIVAAGHRVARIRLERFVTVAWAVLIPLALVDVLASGALAL